MAKESSSGIAGNGEAPIGRIIDPENLLGGSAGGSDPSAGDGNGGGGNSERVAGPVEFERDDAGNLVRNADGSPRKRRGRKPGAGNGSARKVGQKAKSDISITGVEKILLSLHSMAAVGFRAPELMLDETEARAMGEGIMAVQSHYNFDASAEVIAWVNLAMILMGIYGPRIMLIRDRKREESPKKKESAAQVIPGVPPELMGQVHASTA